jgi:hypothetical protein
VFNKPVTILIHPAVSATFLTFQNYIQQGEGGALMTLREQHWLRVFEIRLLKPTRKDGENCTIKYALIYHPHNEG